MRAFTSAPAVLSNVPLLIGLVGSSNSGKTYSGLRLLTGMQRVIGGEIGAIDTEARRMSHYASKFRFQVLDLEPPHGPLDYLGAIEHFVDRGVKLLLIDSMTHEHSGVGGVLDQAEAYLQEKAGDDFGKRQKLLMSSLIEPKKQRKRLNTRIVQLGINVVFCYRAAEKLKPVRGGEPEKLGWQPETTSTLYYDMTTRFLLRPGSDGRPDVAPETEAEKLLVKQPAQFREWFKPGFQLDEDLGEKMARWAAGAPVPTEEECAAACAAIVGKPHEEQKAIWKSKPWTAPQKARLQLAMKGPREPGAEG